VESLLVQSHKDLTVVVVNDGDPDPPWNELAHIRDPRLVRFSLQANRGPYFASAVVLEATTAPYFLIQDADDWSAPNRVACLLDRLERDRSDLAVSAQPQYVERAGGHFLLSIRWERASSVAPKTEPTFDPRLTPSFRYRAPHAGLFRAKSLRQVGGYCAGFRVGYDTLLTNLVLMTGRISHVPLPLYFRLVRPESLTHSSQTGVGSAFASSTHQRIVRLYRACFFHYSQFLAGRMDSMRLKEAICDVCSRGVSPAAKKQLLLETDRLRQNRVNQGGL
jgi:hypothetical protein